MAISFDTKTYNADGYTANAATYIGPAKTGTVKDDLRLSRTAAKATATYSGNNRRQAKYVRNYPLTGALTSRADLIGDCNFSVPVGVADADVDAYATSLSAFFATAAFKTFLKTGQTIH